MTKTAHSNDRGHQFSLDVSEDHTDGADNASQSRSGGATLDIEVRQVVDRRGRASSQLLKGRNVLVRRQDRLKESGSLMQLFITEVVTVSRHQVSSSRSSS